VEARDRVRQAFERHVYGRAPVARPDSFSVKASTVPSGKRDQNAVRLEIAYTGPGGSGGFEALLMTSALTPVNAPTFLLISHRDERPDFIRQNDAEFWPVDQILARGYATVLMHAQDVDPDEDDGFANGVHGVFGRPDGDESWGTIAAWAWAAQRVLDALEDRPEVDARRVAVVGHSRGGKTALWAAANDPRFAMAVSNNSGCSGAALTRGGQGETIAQINDAFPHWFSGNYRRYSGDFSRLPIDQHQLLALIAPRLIYVASAVGDTWADPQSEFLATLAAGEAWPNSLEDAIPWAHHVILNSPVHAPRVGYHLRSGGHGLMVVDWFNFLDFADLNLCVE